LKRAEKEPPVKELLYLIPAADRTPEGLRPHLERHPEIRFVSFAGVDLGGNDTDERIPVGRFLARIEDYLAAGIQTDGSSVVLPGIAALNDCKVDLTADAGAVWYVDYNHEFPDPSCGRPVGTLRIPSFLKHRGRLVDSRALLKSAIDSAHRRFKALIKAHPAAARAAGIDPRGVASVEICAATELEFWVRTPRSTVATEKLSVSQILQESYWKRTKGAVRTALEHALMVLESYGLAPEKGHKEVGGVKAVLTGEGEFDDILEQLEIDWAYAPALQAADNELLARIMIKETFRRHGLEVTFMAKPIDGVAGSGEHTHLSVKAVMRDGTWKNLFAPADPRKDFLSPFGWGALMGLLKNYEAIGPFITASNDAFNRLKPGFEAPVCIVASVGHEVGMPSRNRTVLAGLVRDLDNPLATRFEMRSPHPHSNTFLGVAAFCQAMTNGAAWAAGSGATAKELEAGFSKRPGEAHPYLEKERAYRSEEDVFEHYRQEERDRIFGAPPATVWETMENLRIYAEKTSVLKADGVFTDEIIASYRAAALLRWTMELSDRIVPENAKIVRSCVRMAGENRLDAERWSRIQVLKDDLTRDNHGRVSVFTRIREAAAAGAYAEVSRLQLEMAALMKELTDLYQLYRRNVE
jgi:glutamine synthetase